jgi:hypothetical protein
MPANAAPLYAVRECSDVFVDAALRDNSGELLFLSAFGRDTAILQFFASFTLPVTNGGRNAFTLVRESETHRVAVTDANSLEKLTGRLPRGNLFGNLVHAWLYKGDFIKPDRSNRSVLVLRFGETEEAFMLRVWLLLRDLCPVPLLDHWREPLLSALGAELITPLSAGNAPPIGMVDGVYLALPLDFERVVSAAVARQALTMEAEHMPPDCCERIRSAAQQVKVKLEANTEATAEGGEPESGGERSAPLFELGRCVCTNGVNGLIEEGRVNPRKLLFRHVHGDWGTVCESDGRENNAALKNGTRIFSAYPIDPSQPSAGHGDNTIWVITEADRSATTLLLPDEY